MKSILIIFAKAPEPGKVKTRLVPFLSEKEAAAMHEAFILDTLQLTDPLPLQRAIACTPTPDHLFFQQCGKGRAILFIQQEGGDLGERMENAFQWGFSEGFEKIILLGSDTPTLPIAFIQEGLSRLDFSPWVIGPSLDGGYYLIGGTSPLPDLFSGIRWGEQEVLTKTLEKLDEQQTQCHLLPFWYDIDRPEDLAFLKSHIKLSIGQGISHPKETWKKIRGLAPLRRWENL
ncbi:MAG: TIGR04282 family arsenosugar biosynthesis glycosyltransferase [Nitrospiria bacterium]